MRIPFHEGPLHNTWYEGEEPLPAQLRMLHSKPVRPDATEVQLIISEYSLQHTNGGGQIQYGYVFSKTGDTLTAHLEHAVDRPEGDTVSSEIVPVRRRGRPPLQRTGVQSDGPVLSTDGGN